MDKKLTEERIEEIRRRAEDLDSEGEDWIGSDDSGGWGFTPKTIKPIIREDVPALVEHIRATREETRGLLIYMRRYILSHDLAMGESVGWMKLKDLYDVGKDTEAEEVWARRHGYLP